MEHLCRKIGKEKEGKKRRQINKNNKNNRQLDKAGSGNIWNIQKKYKEVKLEFSLPSIKKSGWEKWALLR